MWPWGRVLELSPVVTTNLILDSQTEMATVMLAMLIAILTDTDTSTWGRLCEDNVPVLQMRELRLGEVV